MLKKITIYITFFTLCFYPFRSFAQLITESYETHGHSYDLYIFKMDGKLKVKYFASNAYERYEEWQDEKKVLAACAGAFSDGWELDSKPIGLTVDNGEVVNRVIDNAMDGLVLVTEFAVDALDLDNLEAGIMQEDGEYISINPRKNVEDKNMMIMAAERDGWTIFQTQLIYSSSKNTITNLHYGKEAERRFLAICSKNGQKYNIIVNAPDDLHLNLSAKYAKEVLEKAGFELSFLLNLDTGGKDIFVVRIDNSLEYLADDSLEEATNLIIYYVD